MRFTLKQPTLKRPAKVVTFVALAVVVTLLVFKLIGSDRQEPVSAPAHANDQEMSFAYTGPGSCSSTNCHGALAPKMDKDSRIQQNEYTIWVSKDNHATKAYSVLLEEQSRRVLRNLNQPGKPEEHKRCLACHALDVPKEEWGRSRTLDLSDGVSCESCHGPAERWLGPHTTRGWTHDQSLKLGMYDTRDPVKRAEKCLSCHLGDETKTVDHELIAAGHPDLIFELDTFSALMPVHWRETGEPWRSDAFGARAWAVGQAVALREATEHLARRARGPAWPEFAEYECYACHHDLREPSWRQTRGYKGTAGRLTWNPSRFVVFRHLVRLIAADDAKELDERISTISSLLSQPMTDREKLATAAIQASEVCDRLVQKTATAHLGPQTIRALLRNISGDSEIADAGVRAAEQAFRAVEALYFGLLKATSAAEDPAIRASLGKLSDYLSKPEQYVPGRFVALMNEVNRHFR
jgi:hypothetical protein